MTEQEIVNYLKENKNKGVAFSFMPQEVRDWCEDHKNNTIFCAYWQNGWCEGIDINCYAHEVYALPDDYEMAEFEPHWEEFPINKDGMFFMISDKVYHYYWWNWIDFLNCHHDEYNDFGGWVYESPHSDGEKVEFLVTSPHILERNKDLSAFIVLNGKNETRPAYPTKILFWRYKK